jgi:hypothetical protein
MDQHEKYWPLVVGALFSDLIDVASFILKKAEKAQNLALFLCACVDLPIFSWFPIPTN